MSPPPSNAGAPDSPGSEKLFWVEGLGYLGERQLFDGTVEQWQTKLHAAAPRVGIEPHTVASISAMHAASRLLREGPARLNPMGRTLAAVHALGPAGWLGDPEAPPRDLPPDERDLPGLVLPDGPIFIADAWAVRVHHWSQLLWANLLGLPVFLFDTLVGRSPMALVRLTLALLRARSFRPPRIGAALRAWDSGVEVHPSATVEASVLRRGARVGAGAVVRGAVLGEGAVVEDLALVEGTVVGAGARVQRLAMAKYSVLEPESAFAGIMQLGVIGRGATVKHGAILMDMRLEGPVRVSVRGELTPAPFGLLGVCVGPGATVAQGVRIAPGRVVPAGLTVLSEAGSVVGRLEVPEGCRVARVRDGGLEPVR